jgi:cytoskeletal protein CcmA (bactofilin family)
MMADETTIGSTIVVSGHVSSEENIYVEGRIEGQIDTQADLFVEAAGTIEAEISTKNIDVRGTVIGNVTASDRFEIHEGGSVTGDVKAPRVVLADGSKYKGNIEMS